MDLLLLGQGLSARLAAANSTPGYIVTVGLGSNPTRHRQPRLRHSLGPGLLVPEAEGSLTEEGGSPFVLSSTWARPANLSDLRVPWFLCVL